MIVVSGALVVLAIVFLVIGLVGESLQPVYISIGVSIVAGIFLLLGALQRRGEEETAPGAGEGVAPVSGFGDRPAPVAVTRDTGVDAAEVGEPAVAEEALEEEYADDFGPQVAVVPGRPRYHVPTCRFLAGRSDVEAVPVDAAREQGYTACGVCKPDQMVEAALAAAADEDAGYDETVEPAAVEEYEAEPTPEPEPVAATPRKRAAAASARGTTARTSTRSRAAAAETEAPAVETPAASAPAPAKRTTSQVVVIPDRDKFHTPVCRFVRDVPGTVTVSKATAKRQGYSPCGVCKP